MRLKQPQAEAANLPPAKKVVSTSFTVDALDIILNITAAIITGSVVMLAEALQGLADLTSAGFVLVGLKAASHPPDARRPYGYGRELYVWVLFASLVMLVVLAGMSLAFGIDRIVHPAPIEHVGFATALLMISVVTNGYAFLLSARRLYGGHTDQLWRRFRLSPLVETKTTFLLDLMGSVAAILGLLALLFYHITGDIRFDGWGAITIALMMLVFAVFLLLDVKDLLIGKRVSPADERKIRDAILATKGVRQIVRLTTMVLGPEHVLVHADLHLQNNLVTDQIETLIDHIEQRIRDAVPAAIEIHIELERPKK